MFFGIFAYRFWDNNGAVIAVFLISGILVATIAAVIGWCVCRKRRRRRIRQSISRPLPYPDNPFEDPRESPASSEMRHAERTSTHGLIVNAGFTRAQNRNLLEDEFKPPSPPTTIYSTSRPEMPPIAHAALQSGAAGVGSWRTGVPAPTVPLPPPQDSAEHHERIAAFWQVFCIDRCWSVATGLPTSLPDDDHPQLRICTVWPRAVEEYSTVSFIFIVFFQFANFHPKPTPCSYCSFFFATCRDPL